MHLDNLERTPNDALAKVVCFPCDVEDLASGFDHEILGNGGDNAQSLRQRIPYCFRLRVVLNYLFIRVKKQAKTLSQARKGTELLRSLYIFLTF